MKVSLAAVEVSIWDRLSEGDDELFKQRGNKFVITFGEPIPYTAFDKSKNDREWAADIQERVKALGADNGCEPNMW